MHNLIFSILLIWLIIMLCAYVFFIVDFYKEPSPSFDETMKRALTKAANQYFEENPHLLAKLIEVKQKRKNENKKT